MATLNISPKLLDVLQKLAEIEQLSVNDLAEGVLNYYITERLADTEIGPEEMAAVLEAIAENEVEEAAGIYVTQHEINAMMERMISEHENKPLPGDV